ncbi:hypothetical protein Tco_0247708 [Tanacetum coccineum]
MHTTMVPEQVKTMKIQAGVQVSRQAELRRHLQLWKCFGRLYFIVIVLDRNIVIEQYMARSGMDSKMAKLVIIHNFNGGNCPSCSIVGAGNEFVHDPDPFPYDNTSDFYDQPPQPQYESYLYELCGNDSHFGYDCPSRGSAYVKVIMKFSRSKPMNQNYFEPNPIYNSSYSGFDQPLQYVINHQEDLNQQRISDVYNGWDKIDELQNELFQMIQSFCKNFLPQKQAASIDQSPLQEKSLQEMEDLKQHYLDEMLSLSNDLGIKDLCINGYVYSTLIKPSQKPIHHLSGSPTPSSDPVVASLSLLPTPFGDSDSLLEETDILLSHSDYSLPDYEAFYFDDDHIKEMSSGRVSTNAVEKNIFDLSSTKDSTIIFPSGDKDKVFNPKILAINGFHSKRFSILLMDDFSSILFVGDFVILTDPSKIKTFLSFPSENEDKVFDPGILIIDGIFSFTRKSPHLLIDNIMIDNCHILSEISLKIVSSICFHPKDKEIQGESS